MTPERDAIPVELLPCPFCGMEVHHGDLMDTLYPSGTYWRETDGIRHYIGHREHLPTDGKCWSMHCTGNHGGCGAGITADSEPEVIEKWNRRTATRRNDVPATPPERDTAWDMPRVDLGRIERNASSTGPAAATMHGADVRLFARPDTEREAMLQAALGLARAELARNHARTIEACARVCDQHANEADVSYTGLARRGSLRAAASAIRALSPPQIDGDAAGEFACPALERDRIDGDGK
jgi:hypothetical protein